MCKFDFNSIAVATGGEWLTDVALTSEVDAVVTDSRKDCSNSLFLALVGENFDAHDFLDRAVAQHASALCINRASLDRVAGLGDIPVLVGI